MKSEPKLRLQTALSALFSLCVMLLIEDIPNTSVSLSTDVREGKLFKVKGEGAKWAQYEINGNYAEL